MRRNVLEYDDVMNRQRELIYAERDKVLNGVDIHDEVVSMFPDVVHKVVYNDIEDDTPFYDWDLEKLNKDLEVRLFPKGSNIVDEKFVDECEVKDVYDKVLELVNERYEKVQEEAKEFGFEFPKFERYFLLRVVDVLWMEHIDTMSMLKREISTQGYGGHDPLVAYKREGFDLFDEMIEKIREDTCTFLLNVKFERPPELKKVEKPIPTTTNQKFVQAKSTKVVGRNDPCPCGSGKKYKQCCGR
jgi:preprotein translocase subunit SecA